MNISVAPFAALALITAVASLPAAASPHHTRLIEVDRLVASAQPGAVRIQLQLDDRTRLRRLARAGLDPGLAIDVGHRTEVVALRRHLDVTLPTRRAPHQVSVRLIDRSPQQRHDLMMLTLGGIAVDAVTLPVASPIAPPPPAPPPQAFWDQDPRVIDACRAAVPHAQRPACRQAVAHANRSPVALIAACDKAFYGGDETLQCVRVSVRTPAAVTHTEACDRAFYGDRDTLACVQSAAASPRALSQDIAACDAAFYGNAATLACVQNAARQDQPMSAAIAQCDATFYSDADEAQCVAAIAAASSPAHGQEALTHCDAKMRSDRQELRCLEGKIRHRVARRR